jgi:hypothetical protein
LKHSALRFGNSIQDTAQPKSCPKFAIMMAVLRNVAARKHGAAASRARGRLTRAEFWASGAAELKSSGRKWWALPRDPRRIISVLSAGIWARTSRSRSLRAGATPAPDEAARHDASDNRDRPDHNGEGTLSSWRRFASRSGSRPNESRTCRAPCPPSPPSSGRTPGRGLIPRQVWSPRFRLRQGLTPEIIIIVSRSPPIPSRLQR